ncbi:VIT domain-containing protein [Wenzhouxiangella sp. XN24]|uniref:VIT domain-containing protein n=1 Tax=Wenzhouxiangella sp. XN24 TaxID=2713569 RepID=UPI0013E9B8D3|nr:VIT domain-containing protein [Wenzhouxiangella sp. XN24]NGX15352.1 VWA domain-containing protein [Wenzhouxiangella sp. XN24]
MQQTSAAAVRPSWRTTCRQALAFVVLLLPGIVWFPGDADATGATLAPIHDPREANAGSLWLRPSPEADVIAGLSVMTGIQVRVTGSTARVEITQRFRNPSDEWMEGLYVYPLASSAAVDRLTMHFGERIIRGEIQPRETALAHYEKARRSGRQASLVAQDRPNMFMTSVANIAPRSEITVRIAYLEIIPFRDGRYTLKLPLAITPRFVPGGALEATPESVASSGTVPRADIEIDLRPGFPLASLDSHHHALTATRYRSETDRRVVSSRAAMDRDFELSWTPQQVADTVATAFTATKDAATHALVTLMPPDTAAQPAPPREVIFIIDTSGSMGGDPLRQAKTALQLAIARLGADDRFNIIRFSDDASALFAAPQAADPLARATAQRFVHSLRADGGTRMHGALALALDAPSRDERLRQIVFITDGSVGNEAELIELIDSRLGAARLFTLGIGAAPNAWFLAEAAAVGRGSPTFIAAAERVDERMADLFRKLERPALLDLELHWPDGAQPDLAAPLPLDLYAGDPLMVAIRLDGDTPPSGLTLAGRDATGHWVRQVPIVVLEGETGIAKLWARERIGALSRRKRLSRDAEAREALDERILALSLDYGLVSELTSLVAVDRTPVRPGGAAGATEQVRTAAPAGTPWARSAGFAPTASPAPLLAWVGALALLFGAGMSVLRRLAHRQRLSQEGHPARRP